MNIASRLLLACLLCGGATHAELCFASDAPPPANTSFAYSSSHPVTPLPETVIAKLAGSDSLVSDEFMALEAPPDTSIDTRAIRAQTLTRSSVCSAVASVARANDLPVPFFANLIWQESAFNPRSISPAGAQGIAQFMPDTAKEYGLANPFDPIHAIHAAGRFLNRLVAQFGNLGLAAAAYNAGPGRVSDYMTRHRQLPDETKNYVIRVTGRPAEKWTSRAFVQAPEARLLPAKAPCVEVATAVAAETRTVELARLAAAAEAAKRAAAKPHTAVAVASHRTGKAKRVAAAKATVRTAVAAVKGKVVAALTTKRAAPVKMADRVASGPAAAGDRLPSPLTIGKAAPTRLARGKTPAKKTVVAKTAVAKTVVNKSTSKQSAAGTRVASAR